MKAARWQIVMSLVLKGPIAVLTASAGLRARHGYWLIANEHTFLRFCVYQTFLLHRPVNVEISIGYLIHV